MKKHAVYFAFAVLGTAFFSWMPGAHADTTLYSQTNSTANSGALGAGVNFIQTLGNGLSGIVHELSFTTSSGAAAGSGDYRVFMSHCDDSGYTSGCVFDFDGMASGGVDLTLGTAATAKTQYFFATTTGYTLNASKYYRIGLAYSTGTQHDLTAYGSAASTVAGDCVNGAGTSLPGIADCFYVINGISTFVDRSYTANLSPTNASTTLTTTVRLQFDYHAAAANSVNSYSIQLYDISSGESISIPGTASTGDHSVSVYVTLNSGHGYNYQAYVCNSAGTCYGGPAVTFYVVSDQFNIESGSASSSIPLPVGPGGTLPSPNFITEANASSTIDQLTQSFLNVPAFMANKFPFSWFYEIGSMIKNASSASTTVPTWSVSFAAASTTLEYPLLEAVGSTTIMSQTVAETFLSYDDWQGLRIIASALMWVGFAYYVLKRVGTVTI